MPALRDLQRAFGRSVLIADDAEIISDVIGDGMDPADRLEIYRNTASTVVTEALRLTFPAIDRLVGSEFFDMAAARFLREHPPVTACLNDYGDDFPAFLATMPEASGLRYLGDVARLEWALSVAATASDTVVLDVLDVVAMAPELHEELRLRPHPSVTLLLLTYPADRIADAVISGDDDAMAALDLSDGPVRLVVHRGPNGTGVERLDEAAYNFLVRLFAGERLGTLLDGAAPGAAGWLADEFTKGRIGGMSIEPAVQERSP
jgi:hypothetical protein